MSGTESRHDEVAKRYGGVLFDLAQENKTLQEVLKDATHLQRSLLQEPLEWSRIISPSTPLKIQQQIIETLVASLKLGPLITQFLRVVCHNHRLQNLVFMLEDFKGRCQEELEGTLETACELPQQEVDHLQQALKQQLGQDVSVRQIVKESLLGGVVLRVGSLMIDASLRTQLHKLRQVMKG